MTSYLNVKNKHGLTKLATLIQEAGLMMSKSQLELHPVPFYPNEESSFKAGL